MKHVLGDVNDDLVVASSSLHSLLGKANENYIARGVNSGLLTIVGTVDTVPGVALFDGDPSTGEANYAGSTHVDWEGQETRKQDAKPLVTCGDHEWATVIEGREGD